MKDWWAVFCFPRLVFTHRFCLWVGSPDAFTSEAYLKVHVQPVRKECGKW
jgi:hypothetical protein